MEIIINEIPEVLRNEAIDIFSDAFYDDPLFVIAFPDSEQRRKQTKIMYEFVVNDMVPMLNLRLKGAFIDDILAGCMIYTTPESLGWSDVMNDALENMRKKANDERINLIGEFARLSGYEPDVEYFYGNELAVGKDYQGKGIGKALCYELINDCKKHSSAMGILIDTANENNVIMYERWGWKLKLTLDFYNIKKFFLWRAKEK